MLRPTTLRAARRRRSRGQALVEFALVLPIMFALLATALDLGRIAYAQITVTNAAREGAMQASKTPTSWIAGTACDPSNTDVNLVMCRTQLESKDSWVTISPSDVQLTCTPDCTPALGSTVKVSVTGHLRLVTPLMAGFFGGNLDVSFPATSTAQIEKLPTPILPWPTPTPTPTATPTDTATPTATATEPHCPVPSAGFTATVDYKGGGNSQQAPATITVTDTSTPTSAEYPGCGISTWWWDFGDGYTSSLQDPGSHTYLVPGSYLVKLTVNNPYSEPNTTGGLTVVVK